MSNDTVSAMMRADAATPKPPSKDRLDKARDKIKQLRELELKNAELAETISENSRTIKVIKEKELVDLFDAAEISSLGIEASGNLPAYEVEIKAYYHANIPEENEPKAFAWLTKQGHGDMIKGVYSVAFGMGEEKKRLAFEKILQKGKYQYSYKFGVPWNTLTAFVKEQIEEKKKEPPLKLLGATVGRVASLVKAKKSSGKSTKGK
jgi:hypothetical protein